jgi:predicted AAA+ superfamily ATPase
LYQWLQRNALDYFHKTAPDSSETTTIEEGWEERQQAKKAIIAYLTDTPSTVAFVHGPQGSGKSSLVQQLVSEYDRTVLVIDCKELLKASSDSETVDALAKQTGYWPVFTLLNSMSSLIDLASMGLIGQKGK